MSTISDFILIFKCWNQGWCSRRFYPQSILQIATAKSVWFKCVHLPPKVYDERRHQSWAIAAAWNIEIAGINHPLSELLRLLTRRKSRARKGEWEVLETIFLPDFYSFLSVWSSGSRYHSISPSSILASHRWLHFSRSASSNLSLSSIIPKLNWKHHSVLPKFAYQPETEYSCVLVDRQLQSSDKSWLVRSLFE